MLLRTEPGLGPHCRAGAEAAVEACFGLLLLSPPPWNPGSHDTPSQEVFQTNFGDLNNLENKEQTPENKQ